MPEPAAPPMSSQPLETGANAAVPHAAASPAGAGGPAVSTPRTPPSAGTTVDLHGGHAASGPQPVLPLRRDWPLHDVEASRAVEQQALAGSPPHALMVRAGLGLARLAVAVQPGCRQVLALAGPGNNGGDAVVAATELARAGWSASIVSLGDPARLPDDARWAMDRARQAGLAIADRLPDKVDGGTVVLDGLLGLGARRAPSEPLQRVIDGLAGLAAPVIAVDIPSGLDPERGRLLGPRAVRAKHTLCLLTLKPGLFTAEGRDHAGRVWLDDLGLPTGTGPMQLGGIAAARQVQGPGPHGAHKGRYGDVGVLGGDTGMAGAAILAAQAALTAGAGRVYLALLDPRASQGLRPEPMKRDPQALLTPSWLAGRTLLAGCGAGEAVAAWLPPALAHAARLVLDADALNATAREPALARALAARGARGRPSILTPHPLEAARLLGPGVDAGQVQADRFRAARELAARFGAVVVLKGSGTVMADAGGRLLVNGSGNALLASPGTGDVLAGWLAGLWARVDEALATIEVAAAAVHRHGAAADRVAAGACPPPSLLAGDLIAQMARETV